MCYSVHNQEFINGLFRGRFKNDFINGQLNPARIYPCFIPCINKDTLVAYLGGQEYILVLSLI